MIKRFTTPIRVKALDVQLIYSLSMLILFLVHCLIGTENNLRSIRKIENVKNGEYGRKFLRL